MSEAGAPPTLAEFLALPAAEVSRVAPPSALYAPGGTRRQAVLQGIEPWSPAYLAWAQESTLRCCELFFRLGVRHLFLPLLTPRHLAEENRYRSRIFEQADWMLAGPEILSGYHRLGWKVRLLGTESLPELAPAAARLAAETDPDTPHALYWTAVPAADAPWDALLAAAAAGATTRAAAIAALYGEEIPPITLYVGFGKPEITHEIVPPLLMGDVQCYWSQRAGYSLDEEQLRTILYDYAYTRRTWQRDKLGRAEAALAQRDLWVNGPILGLGRRAGPFWYPNTGEA